MTDDSSGGLLAISISIDDDDSAESAAGTTPSLPRTHQSHAAFLAQKAHYTAKIDNGNLYAELIRAVPVLAGDDDDDDDDKKGDANVVSQEEKKKIPLRKKDIQLLGYAVGEMYFDQEYERIVRLLARVRARVDMRGTEARGLEERVRRWEERCGEKTNG